MAKLSMGQGGIGGIGGIGGYFSKILKRLKTVLMMFKMLNEGYLVILYQKGTRKQ